MRIASVAVAVASMIVLGGCASSLSGVGGTEGYACKAPIGAQCTSVSGVYANAKTDANAYANVTSDLSASRAMHEALRPQGLLGMPSIHAAAPKTESATAAEASLIRPSGASLTASVTASVTASGTVLSAALRSPPRVLRLWISPWEDADGDLHEASLVHVVIDTGRWLIERVRPAPRSRIDIATPPLALVPAPATAPELRPATDLGPTEP